MSKISRMLKRMDKDIKGTPYTWLDTLEDRLDESLSWAQDKLLYWEIRAFLTNLPHFLKQAWYWRSWDSCYTIETFCQNLERMGRVIRDTDRHTTASKSGNRAIYAAHLLRQAYSGDMSKEAVQWWTKNHFESEEIKEGKHKGMFTMNIVYKKNKYIENYEEKVHEIIKKRDDRIEQERKDFAWRYIQKHIERWWS